MQTREMKSLAIVCELILKERIMIQWFKKLTKLKVKWAKVEELPKSTSIAYSMISEKALID